MQDINSLIFDEEVASFDKLKSEDGIKELREKLNIEAIDNYPLLHDNVVPRIDVEKKPLSLKEDIREQKIYEKNKLKASIFDSLFENEQQLYFNEHKHVMPSKEKKRLKAILIKKINNGDIYLNKVGKLIIRKGKNK